MSTATENSFGNLLRSYRRAAGLSQEELAERANLSARTISDLERGLKAVPHRETVRLLGEALDLTPDDLARFDGSISRRRGQRPDASSAEDVRLSGHLPVPPTPMIGREREQAEVMRLLRQERVRLLTLTGPPGVGKTRLGLAVAAELQDAYAGGVVFVNLVPLRDAGLVGATIAHALGLQEARGQSATEVLTAYLRRKQMLLVLDNFEHLLEAATLVGELLAACPDLSVLVTSRWALEMRAEYLFEVPVLACPPLEQALSDENAIAYPAVQLFVERARAVQQDFRLHADIVPAVTRICRRLDGLPLAIELAAPWTRVLSPMALQTRLEHHVLALVADARDRAGRHRTLRDTLAWSYELLEVEEQRLLRDLASFWEALRWRPSRQSAAWTVESTRSGSSPRWSTRVWCTWRPMPPASVALSCWKWCASMRWRGSAKAENQKHSSAPMPPITWTWRCGRSLSCVGRGRGHGSGTWTWSTTTCGPPCSGPSIRVKSSWACAPPARSGASGGCAAIWSRGCVGYVACCTLRRQMRPTIKPTRSEE